jgi:hypothetical protein
MEWQWIIMDQTNEYIIYRLKNNFINQYISWKDIFENYSAKLFIDSFIKILSKTNPFDEYYIEFCPTTFNKINFTIFEFVLIKTKGFSLNADIITFGSDLLDTNSNKIIWFPNPSNSSILITPCYNHMFPINDYIHIGTFMRSQNYVQKKNLIKTMFELYLKELSAQHNKKLWLSTHGKGVAWLHIRIDKTPKYISWNPYK